MNTFRIQVMFDTAFDDTNRMYVRSYNNKSTGYNFTYCAGIQNAMTFDCIKECQKVVEQHTSRRGKCEIILLPNILTCIDELVKI